MIPPPPRHRSAVAPRLYAVFTVALGAAIAGCSPAPTPTPTPTPAFASEEEAFAAAEETYRAYNDALNAVDPADPATFEAVYEYTSGGVRKADQTNFTEMHAEGQTIEGDAEVVRFVGRSAKEPFEAIVAVICVDVRGVVVRDAAGSSIVNPLRPGVYEVEVTLKERSNHLLVDGIRRVEGSACEGL